MSLVLNAYITTKGIDILNSCIGNEKPLTFTKAEIGSGYYDTAAKCRAATALKERYTQTDIISNVSIISVSKQSGVAKVSVRFTNSAMVGKDTVTIREIGIFAKNPSDGDKDTLLCYATFGESGADEITGNLSFSRIYDIMIGISNKTTLALTATPSGYQSTIMETGLLVGDGNGGVRAAVAGTDYAAAAHRHTASDITSGELAIARGGTGANTLAQAQKNLEITRVIYQETEPELAEGAIWLQPVET